jgi:hypothetical protein
MAAAALFSSLALALALPASAVTISGSVTNGTTHQPAAGDDVVLIALSQNMQEIAHAKTNAQGRYTIDSPDAGMHLIRVDHEGAAYFQAAPPNTPNVDLEVFDVAATVPGITTEADVFRMQTDPQGLEVTQSIFVSNQSDPPRTQFSKRSYEFYLPAGATLESSAAQGPGGMPVQSSPMPLGDKDHYAFLFPLRPGESQFQLVYRLPYSGSLKLSPRLATGVTNFVVILPKSMAFEAGSVSPFQTVDVPNQPAGEQTFLIRDVAASKPPVFTVSGSGQIPRDTEAANEQGGDQAGQAPDQGSGQGMPQPGATASTDTRPGIGLGKPIDTPDPLNKYKWWILGGLVLVFATAGGFLLSKPGEKQELASPSGPGSAPPMAHATGNTFLQALKEEIFALETDHVQGKLSDSEYGELKSALELILRRALTRQPA